MYCIHTACMLGRAVQVHDIGGGSASSTPFSNHLRVLTQPVKIAFVRRAGQEGQLKEHTSVIMVEPLATVRAIEDYLWPLVTAAGGGEGGLGDGGDADAFRRNLEAAASRVLERLQGRGEEVEDMVDAATDVCGYWIRNPAQNHSMTATLHCAPAAEHAADPAHAGVRVLVLGLVAGAAGGGPRATGLLLGRPPP
jgi:hypothetical protein